MKNTYVYSGRWQASRNGEMCQFSARGQTDALNEQAARQNIEDIAKSAAAEQEKVLVSVVILDIHRI